MSSMQGQWNLNLAAWSLPRAGNQGVQPSQGARPSRLDHMQILIWTVKAILGWVLLVWVFQIILICPGQMYYFLSIWLRLSKLLVLLLEPGMPSSLFSNSVSLSKISGVMSSLHLWGWGQCFTSGQTSNTQIKRDRFLLSCNKRTSSSLNRFEWPECIIHSAWSMGWSCSAGALLLPCFATALYTCSQLGGLAWKCALNLCGFILQLSSNTPPKHC